MAHDTQLKTDPATLPLKPAILLLIHKRRKAVFVSYTSNARGRASVLGNAIRHRDTLKRNHLRGLPEGGVEDFVIMALRIGLDPKDANEAVERLKRKMERDGYRLFGGTRSAVPKVFFGSRRVTLVQAMEEAGTTAGYQAVYRRLQRGWSVKDALTSPVQKEAA
jgi:hypothetical protein